MTGPRRVAGVGRGAATAALLRLSGLALGFGVALVLGRTLGVAGYGAYAAGMSLAWVLAGATTMGASWLLVRGTAGYLARGELSYLRGLLTRAVQAVVVASVVAAVLVDIGVSSLGGGTAVAVAMATGALLVPLFALATLGQAVLQGLQRMADAIAPNTVGRPLLFVAILGLLAASGASPSPTGALLLQGAATALTLVLLAALVRRALPGSVFRTAPAYATRSWARSAVGIGLSTALTLAAANIGVMLVGAIRGGQQAGLLGAATRVAVLVLVVSVASNESFAPAIARLSAEGRTEDLQHQVTRMTRSVAAVTACLAAATAILAEPVLATFGHGFTGGATALRLLCAGALVNSIASSNVTLLLMTDHERPAAAAAAAGLAATAGLSVVAIPSMGAAGAAGAFVVGTTVRNVVACRMTRERLGLESSIIGRDRAAARL